MTNDRELLELFGALCNDALSETEHERLCVMLTKDPRARQDYYEYLEIHAKLGEWAGAESHSQPLAQFKRELDRRLPNLKPTDDKPTISLMQLWVAVAATALIAFFVGQAQTVDPSSNLSGKVAKNPSGLTRATYIATLSRSADCVWEEDHKPRFDGQRLLSQELRLKRGIAEFRLETGVLLVMEGPATMTIDSSRSATLQQGRVVLHGDEMAEEFALHTPHAVLFDEGTEYGASVDPARSTEVHVFEGRVRIEPLDSSRSTMPTQEVVASGSASRIDAKGSHSVPLENELFNRRIPVASLPRVPSDHDLLALEAFDYAGPHLGAAEGGNGWTGPWRKGIDNSAPPWARILPGESLTTPALSRKGVGGAMLKDGKGTAVRPLSTPLRLDTDAVYYMSFLLRKSREAPTGATQYGSVSLRSSDLANFENNRLVFGMSSENYIIMTHNDHQVVSAPQLMLGESYFYVAKIVAGESDPDQVLLRVYGPSEKVGSSEPFSWSAVSRPQSDDTVFSNLVVFVGGDAAFQVDEVRVGSTWASVTNEK